MFRIKAEKLIVFQIIYCLFLIPWLSYFGVSNIKVIVSDAVNALLLISLLQDRSIFRERIRYLYSTFLWVLAFAAVVIAGFFIINPLSAMDVKNLVLAFWNFRLLFRPFLFMGLCVFYLNKDTVRSLMEVLYKLQFVNIFLTLFQYYVQGYWMDHNGGIFAPMQGCNKYSNVFCLVVTAWVLLEYLNKRAPLHKLVLSFVHLFVVAIYAELKILFVEEILLIAFAVLLSRRGSRRITMVCYGAIAGVVGLVILARLFPTSYQFLTDIDLFMWYTTEMDYSHTAVSVNRLSGFEIINQYMFGDSILNRIFGFGVGMSGSVPFLGIYSAVSRQYATLYYQTFLYSWIYADNGYSGVILYFLCILSIFFSIRTIRKRGTDSSLLAFSQIFSGFVLFLSFYDASWVTEGTTFLMAFCLAAGFVEYKEFDNSKAARLE